MLERAQLEGAGKDVVAPPLCQEGDVGASDTYAAHARLKYGFRHGHVIDSPSSVLPISLLVFSEDVLLKFIGAQCSRYSASSLFSKSPI